MATDSNAYQLRWQRDAHRVLGELLAVAASARMPAVRWTIAISGALVGDIDSMASTPDQQRAAFGEWTRQLDAHVVPERVDSDGVTHLYAKFKVTDGFDVGGAIRATIYPPLHNEAGA